MLVVVVHSVYLGQFILQRLEILIEYCVRAIPILIDQVADTTVRLVAPSTNTYLDTLNACGPSFQRFHVVNVMGLRLVEHILTVFTDSLTVGSQCAVGLDTHIEQYNVRKP